MELESLNFSNYFSILHLEYNFRTNMKKMRLPFENINDYKKNYAKKCAQKYPIKNNKIIFDMRTYVDHGKYITEQLLLMNKNLDIVWLISDKSVNVPENVRAIININWIQYVYEMETARIWVINILIQTYLYKRSEQIYINTKHWSSITLKKFGLEDIRPFKNFINSARFHYIENEYNDNGKLIDYVICGSKFDEDSFRRGYNVEAQFLHFGSPKSDVMFSAKKYKDKVYKVFNLNSNDNTLIYAPTMRYTDIKSGNTKYTFQNFLNFDLLLKSLQQKWFGNWKILLRLHPTVKKLSKKINKPDFVIDVSDYDDSQELVAASDVLISDFSSIMFELAYVLKPVFLYSPDKESFEKSSRELLIDYDSLPFPISTTNEKLSKQILNFDEDVYKHNVRVFLDKYGVHEDGHASERAAKFILKLLSKEGEIRA